MPGRLRHHVAVSRVRLVVVNFNGGDDVVRCVGALHGLDWPAADLEVVVVDNASTDGSADALAAAFPSVRLIRNSVNQGFPANNLAFDRLDSVDYVGLVNSDAFVTPGWLRPLVAALEADPELGAACPKILFEERYRVVETVGDDPVVDGPVLLGDGWKQPDDLVDPRPVPVAPTGWVLAPGGDLDVINNVGNELTAARYGTDRGFGEVDRGQYDSPSEVFAWCGAAVLFPAAYLRDVGGFDERLFLYYEDLDLAWRGRERGWRYRTVPSSVVRHRLGASSRVGSPLFRYQTERNRLVVLAEHESFRVVVGVVLRYLLATASYARRDLLRRRPAPALVWLRLRSFGGFLRLLPHALAARRR